MSHDHDPREPRDILGGDALQRPVHAAAPETTPALRARVERLRAETEAATSWEVRLARGRQRDAAEEALARREAANRATAEAVGVGVEVVATDDLPGGMARREAPTGETMTVTTGDERAAEDPVMAAYRRALKMADAALGALPLPASPLAGLDLPGIEARAEAATPGPWFLPLPHGVPSRFQVDCHHGVYAKDCGVTGELGPDEERVLLTLNGNFEPMGDAAFIGHARTDVPTLVRAVRGLSDERDALIREAAGLRNDAGNASLRALDREAERDAARRELKATRGTVEEARGQLDRFVRCGGRGRSATTEDAINKLRAALTRATGHEAEREPEPTAERCTCPPGTVRARIYERTCPEHGDDRDGQTIVLPPTNRVT